MVKAVFDGFDVSNFLGASEPPDEAGADGAEEEDAIDVFIFQKGEGGEDEDDEHDEKGAKEANDDRDDLAVQGVLLRETEAVAEEGEGGGHFFESGI